MLQASVGVIKDFYFPDQLPGLPMPKHRELVSFMDGFEPCNCTLTLYEAKAPCSSQPMVLRRTHTLLKQAKIVVGDVMCYTICNNERIEVCPLLSR